MRRSDKNNDFRSADDYPPAHRFRGHAFFRLPSAVDSVRTDSKANTFGSRGLPIVFVMFMIGYLLMSGCNDPFQPLQENDSLPFSMTGYLDASADTQWVRITPLRKQVESLLEKPEMKVTIKNIKNGDTAVMNSTLVPFYFPGGYNALNSSTRLDIEAGQTYQLTAERPDGAKSSAEVTIPEDFPTPQLHYIDNTGCLVTLKTRGVENIADVQYRMRIRVRRPELDLVTNISASYRHKTFRESSGRYSTTINVRNARSRAFERFGNYVENTTINIQERYFFIATGGPEWTEVVEQSAVDELVFTLPNFVSNVEDGVGYMFGIVSKSIPDTGCPNE